MTIMPPAILAQGQAAKEPVTSQPRHLPYQCKATSEIVDHTKVGHTTSSTWSSLVPGTTESNLTGPRTPWPNRAETAVRLLKRQLALMTKYLAEEPSLPNPSRTWFRSAAGPTSSPLEEKHHLSWPWEAHQNQFMTCNMRTQHNCRRTHRRKTTH